MYGEYNPANNQLNGWMDTLKRKSLHPVKVYRGSMIFSNYTYGYVHMPDYDDDLRKEWHKVRDSDYPTLVGKHGGTVIVLPGETKWSARFGNLADRKSVV